LLDPASGNKVHAFQIKLNEVGELKGFEGETFELVSISPSEEVGHKDDSKCQLCGGLLVIEEQFDDLQYVKCSSCGYRDLLSFDSDSLKRAA
jgi:DNA-directed RNA polymerase subunit RPC12/RpoP